MMIYYNKRVWIKIISFYNNVIKKYPNTYTIFDAIKDATKSYNDKKFTLTEITKQKWSINQYKVVRNSCVWYFAYYIDNDTAYVVDAENYRNMKEYQTQHIQPNTKQQIQYQTTNKAYNGYRLVKAS